MKKERRQAERRTKLYDIKITDLVSPETIFLLQPATDKEIESGKYITLNWQKYSIDPKRIAIIKNAKPT